MAAGYSTIPLTIDVTTLIIRQLLNVVSVQFDLTQVETTQVN